MILLASSEVTDKMIGSFQDAIALLREEGHTLRTSDLICMGYNVVKAYTEDTEDTEDKAEAEATLKLLSSKVQKALANLEAGEIERGISFLKSVHDELAGPKLHPTAEALAELMAIANEAISRHGIGCAFVVLTPNADLSPLQLLGTTKAVEFLQASLSKADLPVPGIEAGN